MQKPKRYKKVFKCKKSKPAKMHKNTTQAPAINTQKEKKHKKILKNAKTQKEKNMQKEQKNKKNTFAPAISTSYLLIFT